MSCKATPPVRVVKKMDVAVHTAEVSHNPAPGHSAHVPSQTQSPQYVPLAEVMAMLEKVLLRGTSDQSQAVLDNGGEVSDEPVQGAVTPDTRGSVASEEIAAILNAQSTGVLPLPVRTVNKYLQKILTMLLSMVRKAHHSALKA
ncbi:unnamed protein product [Arctogadus glacialis]